MLCDQVVDMTLNHPDKREMGQQFERFEWSLPFGIGTTDESFHLSGNIPDSIDMLNKRVSIGVML